MSAIAAYVTSREVQIMTDGLSYIDGVPSAVDCRKAVPIMGMKAVVACTGPALLGLYLADNLAEQFASFDELTARGSGRIRMLFEEYVAEYRNGDAVAMMALAGWHEAANMPGLYVMQMQTDGEKLAWVQRVDPHAGAFDEPAFELTPQQVFATPCPTLDQFRSASYDLLVDLEKVDSEIDLLHQMEIQRRILIDDRSYVGGHAELTTIDASGVKQRIVHRWNEDVPGKPIRPQPIDWKAWRSRKVISAAAIPAGLSRLQRERMEKKARKGKLRAV